MDKKVASEGEINGAILNQKLDTLEIKLVKEFNRNGGNVLDIGQNPTYVHSQATYCARC